MVWPCHIRLADTGERPSILTSVVYGFYWAFFIISGGLSISYFIIIIVLYNGQILVLPSRVHWRVLSVKKERKNSRIQKVLISDREENECIGIRRFSRRTKALTGERARAGNQPINRKHLSSQTGWLLDINSKDYNFVENKKVHVISYIYWASLTAAQTPTTSFFSSIQ
jgi:hypothetical protein